ncbi:MULTISPECIES: MMPL family transporter [unclassified Streptomyces]|uniref:MMPL family transporter n=1 Tax=unclassified Streptomyces TaxID=2593676 RepID=UPI002E821290|nr:MMPL family transporter [Streptomyces sp. NBC_00589]WTI42599.1 MMPL family transporter [Streptomyces sp. NBC_00775]WUB33181.1 MMPL family transporter [Streptomyces sp. NBC_00589]
MARWCYRHRLVVLLLWVGALFGLGFAASTAGTDYATDFSLPNTDSKRAYDLMEKAFPDRAGDTDTVVWKVDGGTVRDQSVRSRIQPALEEIGKMSGVGGVTSPYSGEQGATQISSDGKIAYAQITFADQANTVPKDLVQNVVDTAQNAERGGLQVELGGQAIQKVQEPPTGLAEMIGILAAAVVLFLAFGSLFAMLLPIGIAIFGVGTGLFSTQLISHVTSVPDLAPLLATLIGLGVGIDYALFIVTRHRRGILRGMAPEESAVVALDTSGRAVLFAGGTVCIALAGMLVTNLRFLDGVVIGTSLTVIFSVLAAITLLPALLGLLGARVLSRRQRRKLAANGPEKQSTSGAAARWSTSVQRRPRTIAVLALAVMAVLALPVLGLRLGATDQGNDDASTTTRKAYDLLAEGFGPGFNGPLQVVTSGGDTSALVKDIGDTAGVARVAALPPARGVTVIQVVPTTSPQSEKTDQLIDRLRDRVIPEAGAQAHVGGVTAVSKDFSSITGDRLPYFVATIIGLGFLLLMVAFRSLVVPLTAALMNLIAAAASFGVLVAIFQWGWGLDLLGLGKEGPINSFLPVIMLSLLFGLSMDYQVFLVSRMHEEWVHTKDNARAVRVGLAETSRVINSAALIMVCVFLAFVLSGDSGAAMAGVGLAAAVALDAFILRTALVPAAMHLLGKSNWWLPAGLEKRLPHLAVEPRESAPEEAAPAGGATVVHGFVRDPEGAPVDGAVLTLLSAGGRQLDRVTSLADGSYIVSVPGPGTYLLAATADTYGARARHVVVTDEPLVYDVELAEGEVDAVN